MHAELQGFSLVKHVLYTLKVPLQANKLSLRVTCHSLHRIIIQW
jgi:hypothetical protein